MIFFLPKLYIELPLSILNLYKRKDIQHGISILRTLYYLSFGCCLLSQACDCPAKESDGRFWNREDQANQIRRKDISNLPYITIPLEKFPIGISDDEELTDYENDLKTLASRKILNLSHQSNTDLKLAYGPANLPALSEYDQNYTTLLRNLVAYADCLIKNGFKAEAVPVLEFGISIDSDIRANYTLLAELYKEQGNASKIQELIDKAAALDSMMRSAILEQLHTLQNA